MPDSLEHLYVRPARRLFGQLLIAAGALIAGLSGLCTLIGLKVTGAALLCGGGPIAASLALIIMGRALTQPGRPRYALMAFGGVVALLLCWGSLWFLDQIAIIRPPHFTSVGPPHFIPYPTPPARAGS